MSQLNIHITNEFSRTLKSYMTKSGIKKKSEAIRTALREALERREKTMPGSDFRTWIGMGLKTGLNRKPRFESDDDLWG